MLSAAEGRTQYQPSTRSILHQGLRPVRQHTKVGLRVCNKVGLGRTQHQPSTHSILHQGLRPVRQHNKDRVSVLITTNYDYFLVVTANYY